MDFHDKKVLVTGGSRGIGRAISLAFACRGARVAMLYRTNEKAAAEALALLNALPAAAGSDNSGGKDKNNKGGKKGQHGQQEQNERHLALQGDIANPTSVEQAVAQVVRHFGGLDILVNNAGIGIYHPLPTTTYSDWQAAWRDTLAANLVGPANACFCAAHHMMKNGGGRIINITSRGAFRGEPIKPAYGASKAGLNSLSQSLAVALAPHKIFVGAVAPGFVNTELTADRLAGAEGDAIRAQSPFNRVAEPHEVAHAVLFLASEGAEFSTGTIIDVNGASHLR